MGLGMGTGVRIVAAVVVREIEEDIVGDTVLGLRRSGRVQRVRNCVEGSQASRDVRWWLSDPLEPHQLGVHEVRIRLRACF